MGKALGTIKIMIKEMIAYKYETAIWIFITPISLLVYYFLWSSIYGHTGQSTIAGYTFNQLIAYFVLADVVTALSFTNVDAILAEKIRRGTLIVDLARPLEYFRFALHKMLGERIFFIPAYVLPIILIGIFVFNLKLTSWLWLALAIISIALALLLYFTFVFFLGLAAFWLKEYHGVRAIRNGISWFLSGSIMPLAFFPLPLQKVFAFLPFQYAVYTPIQIYFGKYSILGALSQIGIQLAWITALYLLIRAVWGKAMVRFSAVGG